MSKRSRSNKSNRSAKKFKPKVSSLETAELNAMSGDVDNPVLSAGRGQDGLSANRELDAGALEQRTVEGRLVWNHSTHLQGLIPKLKKLCKQPGVYTVTPAVLGRARSNSPRLLLKVSVPIRGGYKLIARNGKSYQEVFVITSLDKDDLETAIAHALG